MNRRLFKIVSLIGFCLWVSSVAAQQRSCDLEAICISPADTVTNGSSLILRFGAKNLGPDIMFQNEPIFYALFRRREGEITRDYAGAFGGSQKDTLQVGASTIYRDHYSINFSYPDLEEPLVLDYCVRIASWSLDKKGDTIRLDYYDSNAANDTCCKQVVVMPAEQTAIGSVENSLSHLTLYPNPVRHTLYVRTGTVDKDDVQAITIVDIMGRKLLSQTTSALRWVQNVLLVDVRQLPAGLYQVQLHTNKGTQTGKVVVYQ